MASTTPTVGDAATRKATRPGTPEPAKGPKPTKADPIEQLSVEELERQAIELGQRSNRGRAINLLRRALKLDPKRARTHRLLGVLFRDTGRMAKAERSFRKAVRLDPKHPLAWGDLAAVLERAGSHKEALSAANKAVALSPEDAGMRADRAIIRYRLGQLDAAIDDGVAALKTLRDVPRFAVDVALMRMTRGKREDMSAALALLTRARAELRDDPAVALAHAQCLLASGQNELALQAYNALLIRNPRQAWANWGRALVAWRQKGWADAKRLGATARQTLPHVFSAKGHNRRQFFAKDALPFLRWLDDELAPATPAAVIPGGPAVLESLKVRGGCDREAVREALNALIAPVGACFAGHAGRMEARFSLLKGKSNKVIKGEGGLSREADSCILRIVRNAAFPDDLSCRVQATWNRPVQPLKPPLLPQATKRLPAPQVLPPSMLDGLIPKGVKGSAPDAKH